jgi:hypothetical protein
VSFDFLNNFSRLYTVGVGLRSGLDLVTFFHEDKYDTEALVDSNLDPFTSLLAARTSTMEFPSENKQFASMSNSCSPSRASLSQCHSSQG